MSGLTDLSLKLMADGLAAKAFSAVELIEAHLAEIERRNSSLNAIWALDAERALRAAEESDQRRASGVSRGALDGIPVGVKDNIDVLGLPTTNGLGTSWMPEQNAAVIDSLGRAGAVTFAKLGMHEAALGATSDNPHHGRVENPLIESYTPGGSSGGSGAAVAANLLPLAFGTDTLGSVRIPAAYCGVYGLKTSYNLIPTDGVTPLSWSFDHVGPIALSVEDLRLALSVLAPGARKGGKKAPASLRVGIPRGEEFAALHPEIERVYEEAITQVQQDGHELVELYLDLGNLSALRRAALLVIEVEATLTLGKLLKSAPDAFSPELKKFLDYGGSAPATDFVVAKRKCDAAARKIEEGLSNVDMILLPTVDHLVFRFEDGAPKSQADLTGLANLAGVPALSFPVTKDSNGLPISLQALGRKGTDFQLIENVMSL